MYGATAGEVGILRIEAASNQAVCGILPNEKFQSEFLYYVFLAKKSELVAKAAGNAQPNISQIKIKDTHLPMPSLSEQRALVGELNELSGNIDRFKDIYARKLKAISALKQSILQKAFSGELAAPSTQAIKEAAE